MVDDVVLVTDDQIIEAMQLILERCKVLAEPAAAAPLAALLNGLVKVPQNANVVCIVSGGNISPQKTQDTPEIGSAILPRLPLRQAT
ncbi:MAG: pyridoxal-phosphate dependent enzyme [SAR202 cluster bacterium]|nr:pyridoxal-phosphate dependent enzyme [SAR202 cluster bacterium]